MRFAMTAALLLLLLLLAAMPGQTAAARAPATRACSEAAVFTLSSWAGPPLRVFTLRPASAGPDAPVVFVLHGVKRDADRYFADWRGLAEQNGFVLVAPEFSQAAFPGADGYNLGGVLDAAGRAAPRGTWAF
ncbi:MAG: hypothetical protein K2P95_06990, partial [Hyphomonadaceae bacterium]|nr:hypothetical protein [Hyphomonadaceae bacterium]